MSGQSTPDAPLVEALDVTRCFGKPRWWEGLLGESEAEGRRGPEKAVDGVSVRVELGQRVAIIGESGGGKSTLARLLAGLLKPDFGEVRWRGVRVDTLSEKLRHWKRKRHLQLLFQNQYGTMNPALRAAEVVAESVRCHQGERGEEALEKAHRLLWQVRAGYCAERRVTSLSGGERRRVTLACVLAASPRVLIADEPAAGLDPILRNDTIALIERLLADKPNMAFVLISHELDIVARLCDVVHVMESGRIVETLTCDELVAGEADHPHTQNLLRAHLTAELPDDLSRTLTGPLLEQKGATMLEYIVVMGGASIFLGALFYALGGPMMRYLDFALAWLSQPLF